MRLFQNLEHSYLFSLFLFITLGVILNVHSWNGMFFKCTLIAFTCCIIWVLNWQIFRRIIGLGNVFVSKFLNLFFLSKNICYAFSSEAFIWMMFLTIFRFGLTYENVRIYIIFQCLRNGKKYLAVSNICSVCTALLRAFVLQLFVYAS